MTVVKKAVRQIRNPTKEVILRRPPPQKRQSQRASSQPLSSPSGEWLGTCSVQVRAPSVELLQEYKSASEGEKTIAIMPTIPSRIPSALKAVQNLHPQVDELHVLLNGHSHKEGECFPDLPHVIYHRNHSGTGPLSRYGVSLEGAKVVISVDDDLELPSNYVRITRETLSRRGPFAATSWYGLRYSKGKNSCKEFEFNVGPLSASPPQDLTVSYLGSGLFATWGYIYNLLTKYQSTASSVFEYEDDIWLAAVLFKLGVTGWCPKRPQGLYVNAPSPGVDALIVKTIHDKYKARQRAFEFAQKEYGWNPANDPLPLA